MQLTNSRERIFMASRRSAFGLVGKGVPDDPGPLMGGRTIAGHRRPFNPKSPAEMAGSRLVNGLKPRGYHRPSFRKRVIVAPIPGDWQEGRKFDVKDRHQSVR